MFTVSIMHLKRHPLDWREMDKNCECQNLYKNYSFISYDISFATDIFSNDVKTTLVYACAALHDLCFMCLLLIYVLKKVVFTQAQGNNFLYRYVNCYRYVNKHI